MVFFYILAGILGIVCSTFAPECLLRMSTYFRIAIETPDDKRSSAQRGYMIIGGLLCVVSLVLSVGFFFYWFKHCPQNIFGLAGASLVCCIVGKCGERRDKISDWWNKGRRRRQRAWVRLVRFLEEI